MRGGSWAVLNGQDLNSRDGTWLNSVPGILLQVSF